jgi:hypothetical protein
MSCTPQSGQQDGASGITPRSLTREDVHRVLSEKGKYVPVPFKNSKLGTVVPVCHPRYAGGGGRRIEV